VPFDHPNDGYSEIVKVGARFDSLRVPADFSFAATAHSHGWCVLAPFAWHEDRGVLERVLRLPGGPTQVAFTQPSGRGGPIVWEVLAGRGSRGGLVESERALVVRDATRMFRLDADLRSFHALCRERGGNFARAARAGFGRLLRAPTLFEDVVKVLATTNTTWGGTKAMVSKLVTATRAQTLGSFPTPREVASLGAARLASEGRWGYRAQYLDVLCRAIVDGELDLDVWESWSGTTEALEREIRSVRGLGPYAAAHVLALLGRHDRIGVDTVFRAFVRATYFPRARKPPSDRRLLAVYDTWGSWRGLAYWADLWYAHHFARL
jgi:3-methyladenine DNA glycosylase/8-oxoguanine DNA glycosylase